MQYKLLHITNFYLNTIFFDRRLHKSVATYEECAVLCNAYGFSGSSAVAGVECDGQCFCAKSFSPSPGSLVLMNHHYSV